VCHNFKEASKSWEILGPKGIGKSTFLSHVKSRLRESYSEGEICFRDVQLSQFEDQLKEDAVKNAMTVYFFDDVEELFDPPASRGIGLVQTLVKFRNQRSIIFLLASRKSLADLLPESEHALRERLSLNSISLGLIEEGEANEAIESVGVDKKDVGIVRDIAGCYPLFLVAALEELESSPRRIAAGALDKEWLERKLLERKKGDFKSTWQSLNDDGREKGLLYRLAKEQDPAKGDQGTLKKLKKKALVTPKNFLFSSTFKRFILEETEYSTRSRFVAFAPRFLWWDRTRTLGAMFFLLAIYAIAMPLLLSQTKQQEQVSVLVGLPTVFIVIFFVLTLVYVIQKRSR
jgi:hypothetical protein